MIAAACRSGAPLQRHTAFHSARHSIMQSHNVMKSRAFSRNVLIMTCGQKEVTMPSLRLTRTAINEIPFAQKGQVLYRDTMLPGFGLRVGAQSKVFFAEGQVNRRTRRVTIGRADSGNIARTAGGWMKLKQFEHKQIEHTCFPGRSFGARRLRSQFQSQFKRHRRALAPFVFPDEGGALAEVMQQRPEILGALIWPYQCASWTP
jgi:hypothetical protein